MQTTLDSEQLDAVYLLQHEAFGVITGNPGTGKSTIVRTFLEHGRAGSNREVQLLAPTGRAARRLMEVTGHEAATVHRFLLQYKGGNPPGVILVDEASMLDVGIAAKLFQYAEENSVPLFLIGDANQLPSVGAGSVLRDIIASDRVPVVHLRKVYRSAKDSWVCGMAPRVLEGAFDFSPAPGFTFVEQKHMSLIKEKVVEIVKEAGTTDPSKLLILAPQNVGEIGIGELCVTLQAELNRAESDSFAGKIGATKYRVYENDRVICTANDYKRGVFNGEFGVVRRIEGSGKDAVQITFDSGTYTYSKSEAASQVRLAYALTVHKAQGAEADHVVFIAHENHRYMLNRRLFYTAITRSKSRVTLIGQRQAVRHAVANTSGVERVTALREHLTGETDASPVS